MESFSPNLEEPLVIAVSVGPAIDANVAEYLIDLAKSHREVGQEVVLFPCENRTGDYYRSFLSQMAAIGCFIAWTVVDRMCFDRVVIDQQILYVSVEHHSAWIIRVKEDEEALSELVAMLFEIPEMFGITYVNRIRPHMAKKARIVNGSHFALALKMGCQTPDPKYHWTNEFIRDCDGIRAMIETMHGAYIESLIHDFPGSFTREELSEFAEQFRERLESEADTSERIMRRLNPHDLEEWIKSYLERVHEPMEAFDGDLAHELATDLYTILERRNLPKPDLENLSDRSGGTVDTSEPDESTD